MSLDLDRSAPHGSGGTVLVTAGGDLELHTVPEFRRMFERARPDGEGLVLDLSKLEFLDSSGLTAILVLRDLVEAGGGRMAVVSNGRMVTRRFDLTGLNEVLGVVGTREQALAAVNGGAS
jgi:anti-sigma B factor antagonist